MGARMHMEMTRTGYGPALIPDPPVRVHLPIKWYAPKPVWMDHIPGPFLCFGTRFAFNHYLERA
jgi:hypothetical protein